MLALSACALGRTDPSAEACQASQFTDQAPEGAESLPATWLRNEEATLWVANLELYEGRWFAGSEGMKIHWWRSRGSFAEDPLSINGSLHGAGASELSVHIPCCYDRE
jgi:hypothetical protein